jgi:hypothetical protein
MMIYAFKGMLVECKTQLRLFLVQFNSGTQFSLKGNMQYKKKPTQTELISTVVRWK